ncbi:DUF3520 domain-containing protein [Paroceanicella profunda]|uniref:DUF3520 domain-containing protein n=1 Tax=Paroceanicella profunda TaxID=2579971 RepID=A0A5B8FHD5_9RHOB|nr:von Willebrand factor type A domain-containing protein [Paroceanicella profunda]QDL92301.1 DUF3520 domain-containing protein [Paroceanicella profunda]
MTPPAPTTDPLHRLGAALAAAPPEVDATARARTIAAALASGTTVVEADGAASASTTAAEAEGTTSARTAIAEAEGAASARTTDAEAEGAAPASTTAAEAEGAASDRTAIAEVEGAASARTTAAEAEDPVPASTTVAEAEGTASAGPPPPAGAPRAPAAPSAPRHMATASPSGTPSAPGAGQPAGPDQGPPAEALQASTPSTPETAQRGSAGAVPAPASSMTTGSPTGARVPQTGQPDAPAGARERAAAPAGGAAPARPGPGGTVGRDGAAEPGRATAGAARRRAATPVRHGALASARRKLSWPRGRRSPALIVGGGLAALVAVALLPILPQPEVPAELRMALEGGGAASIPDQQVRIPPPGTGAAPPPALSPLPAGTAQRQTAERRVSGFTLAPQTGALSQLRNTLARGVFPAPGAVPVEALVNAFAYDWPAPRPGDPVPLRLSAALIPTPWNPETRLLRIGIRGAVRGIPDRPPLSLVLVADLGAPEDIALLRAGLGEALDGLGPDDRVAVLGPSGETLLAPLAATERARILAALAEPNPGPSVQEGLAAGLALADRLRTDHPGIETRVILASDVALPQLPQSTRGIPVSLLGLGDTDLPDARAGEGVVALVDSPASARRALASSLADGMSAARDARVQVEFNPATVMRYRYVGATARDGADDTRGSGLLEQGGGGVAVDPGHTVTALYEITPAPLPDTRSAKRGTADSAAGGAAPSGSGTDLALVRLRYSTASDTESRLTTLDVPAAPATPGPADSIALRETRFAAAVAGFGLLLEGRRDLGAWGFAEAAALARDAAGPDESGRRAALAALIDTAAELAAAPR